jgi:hypothetical protein
MMNLITTADTSASSKSFTDIRPQWKALAADRKITSQDIAALCIYRSMIKGKGKDDAIERLRRSFIPVTNPIKLANGAAPFWGMTLALYMIRNSTLIEWLSPDEKQELLLIAKSIKITGLDIL